MERLGDDEQKHFAESILGWILRAKRLLKMRELQEALAVESDDTELNRSLINPPASILHACGGLIDHDASTDVVKFSHETVREYVERAKFEHLTSHSMIAETCLTYLSFDAICGPCQDFQSLKKRMTEYAFGEYAAHFWGEHAYAAMQDDNVDDAIFKAFQNADVRDSMYQMTCYSHGYIPTDRSLLHLASMHGLLTMCESLLGTSTLSTKLYASSSVC